MATPPGPSCAACGAPAIVHWQRRLTDAEVTEQQDIEQARRWEIGLLADPDQPPPVFPPLPDFLDATTVVPACADHSISLELAALVHAKDCAAPPVCACTPEPTPDPEPQPEPAALPPGW
jgi:hypothetical protein